MVLRKTAKVYRKDSTEQSLAEIVSELSVRVDVLEKGLTNRVRGDAQEDESHTTSFDLYGEDSSTEPISARSAQPGNPSPLSKDVFAVRRDDTVRFFECFWPELEQVIRAGRESFKVFREALLLRFPARDGDATFQRLLANVGLMHQAIYGTKDDLPYPFNPRQLAYALAGVPELALRTSWDRGRSKEERSLRPIHFRAMREHIQRCHNDWYERLLLRGPNKVTMRRFPADCPDCARFLARPDRIMPAVEIQPHPLASGEWPYPAESASSSVP